jgi:cytochrome c554/c'-like protein
MKGMLQWMGIGIAAACAASVGLFGATSTYFSSHQGKACTSCHEMAQFVTGAHGSAHRNLKCQDCHQESLRTKLRHVRAHLAGHLPEMIRMRDTDVLQMNENCRGCHQHEYAAWKAGPHSATYRQIFADPQENSRRRLADDCLRCHGMHFDGAIGDLVQPQDVRGPWRIVRRDLAEAPTMPCSSCHWIHRDGTPQSKPASRISVAGSPFSDSLGFYDRREQMHFAAPGLSIPQVYEGATPVRMSPDQRQTICYQCHAPRFPDATTPAAAHGWRAAQAGSGDDRTPMGVHEGLSCFACHNGHNENARASCKSCHQKTSECGVDVESMDTSYASASSRHNIHWVRCVDCHAKGVPQPKSHSSGMVAAAD